MKTTPIPTFPLRGKESEEKFCRREEEVPLPLRGKEVDGKSVREKTGTLPLRGRDRVGVVFSRITIHESRPTK